MHPLGITSLWLGGARQTATRASLAALALIMPIEGGAVHAALSSLPADV